MHSTNAEESSDYNHNQSESQTETNENQVSDMPLLESSGPLNDMEWQESANQTENWPEESLEHGRREWQQSTEGGLSEWHDEAEEESDSNWHENTDQDWFHRTPEDATDGNLPERDDWHDNDSQVTVENWLDEPSLPSRNQFDIPINRVNNRFVQSDDENVYSIELRELLSR